MKIQKPETIGGRLRLIRVLKGMQQKDVAKQIGSTQCTMSLWESNKTVPETKYIIALSNLYGVTTDFILKGESYEE